MANLTRRENREVARNSIPEYLDPFRMMNALLRWGPFRGDWGELTPTAEFLPRFDLKETKEAYVITADLPGVKDENVEVSVTGNRLTISGTREEERRDEGETYFAMERDFGTFAHSFTLPEGVDPERVKADLKSGVLTVQVPKKPEAQPKRVTIGKGSESKARA